MHAISEDLDDLMNRLDREPAALLEQTIRDAMNLANKRTKREDVDEMGYPVGYFDLAGSFADEPLERPADLNLEPPRER